MLWKGTQRSEMKKRIITITAVIFLLMGSVLIIAPMISNEVGKSAAHSAVEKFEELKNSIEQTNPTSEPTSAPAESKPSEKKTVTTEPPESGERQSESGGTIIYHIDSDRLYRDSVAYNENLKTRQYDLLIDEYSYQQVSLNLYDYGVPDNIYGYISAPSIDMELPIYLGGTVDNMSFGAAHLTYTSLPIGGESTNCVLAAHTGYIGRIFFDYIRYLNVGDEVTVTNLWNKLTYRVTDKRVYKKYESADCYIKEGQDFLTLITCANGGADRYYVLCDRVTR